MHLDSWQALVLGLVEGVTEYLPVSSTGHLILASALMGLDTPERQEAVNDFTIVVQGGAILAVLILYWPSVARMARGLMGKDGKGFQLLVNVGTAFLPAAVFGFLLDKHIEKALFHPGPVLLALGLGGVWMIWLSLRRSGRLGPPPSEMNAKGLDDLTPRDALVVGLLQCVAMWPGTSRSMMTITGGMLVGLPPKRAAEFSFLLGLPTLGAATVYKLLKNVMAARAAHGPNMFEALGWWPCVLGIVVAAVSAAVAVRFLVAFLGRRGLAPFGVYRLALAVLMGVLVAGHWVRLEKAGGDVNRTQRVASPVDWGEKGTGR